MSTCWSCFFIASLILIRAHNGPSRTSSRRSYRPLNTCSVPVSRDYMVPMLDAGKVGTITRRSLVPHKTHQQLTVAIDPPAFEIPEFLSARECEAVIESARRNGMKPAKLFGNKTILPGGVNKGRVGETTFIKNSEFLHIRERVASLTRLPLDILLESEGYQIGHYWPGGFYRDHYDSTWEHVTDGERPKPCCHQVDGKQFSDRCILCRYVTLLIYLNDVEEGGETGFPDVGVKGESPCLVEGMYAQPANCSLKSVVVKPEKGKALLWYNHYRDSKTGWLGPTNPRSMHGGCDVIRGEKWIANVWINIPRYENRNHPSIYGDRDLWE